jgi:hypothetical protein
MSAMRSSGRVEQSRRHGPFDPRCRRRPSAPPRTTRRDDTFGPDGEEAHRVKGEDGGLESIRDWESEGGALQLWVQIAA